MFKRWSNQSIQFCTLLLTLGAMLLYISVMILQASLSCVDSDGCLQQNCVDFNFKDDYKTLIDTSVSNNQNCRYILGSTREVNQRTFDYSFADDFVDTCQSELNKFALARIEVEEAVEAIVTMEQLESDMETALNNLVSSDVSAVGPIATEDGLEVAVEQYRDIDQFQTYIDAGMPTFSTVSASSVDVSEVCTGAADVVAAEEALDAAVVKNNAYIAINTLLSWPNFQSTYNRCNDFWGNSARICDPCATDLSSVTTQVDNLTNDKSTLDGSIDSDISTKLNALLSDPNVAFTDVSTVSASARTSIESDAPN